jgi:hypothetical protein
MARAFFVVKLLVNLRAILRVAFLLAVFLLALGYLVPPFPAFGVWRHLARLNLARDEKLESTEKGQDVEKIADSSRTGRMNGSAGI